MKLKKLFLFVLIAAFAVSGVNAQMFDVEPNVSSCIPGKLSSAEKAKVIKIINDIRAHHKLGPVTWNDDVDIRPQSAALSMAQTGTMSHDHVNGSCTTPNSDSGRSQSNLMLGSRSGSMANPTSESDIIGWLIDNQNAGDGTTVGHRRLIINPFLKTTAFGRVDAAHPTNSAYKINAAALWGITSEAMGNSIKSSCENDFVAYPYENYPPSWVDKSFYLSFGPIPNANQWWTAGAVDFANAKVTMTDSLGSVVKITKTASDNTAWGAFQHNISWLADGLKDSIRYNVKITGVKVNNMTREYEYWFKLTDEPTEIIPENPLAAEPKLLLPANDTSDVTAPVIFKWNKSEFAEYYDIIGSMSSDFTYIAFESKGLKDTTFTSTTPLTNNNTYYWKVIAYNIDTIPTISPIWKFTSKEIIPDAPVAVYPLMDNDSVARRDEYKWDEVGPAMSYNLQIAKTINFATSSIVVDRKDILFTHYYLEDTEALDEFSLYFWRVNAKLSETSNTEWSEPIKFKTNDIYSDIEEQFIIDGYVVTCYPNPFNSQTNISINSNNTISAQVVIYNVLGKEIANLFNGTLAEGINTFSFQPNGLDNGIYFCKISIGNSHKVIPINFINNK